MFKLVAYEVPVPEKRGNSEILCLAYLVMYDCSVSYSFLALWIAHLNEHALLNSFLPVVVFKAFFLEFSLIFLCILQFQGFSFPGAHKMLLLLWACFRFPSWSESTEMSSSQLRQLQAREDFFLHFATLLYGFSSLLDMFVWGMPQRERKGQNLKLSEHEESLSQNY